MGLISTMLAAAGFVEKRDAMDNRWWGPSGDFVSSAAGVSVTRETALELDTVQAVREILSGAISTLPFMLFKRDGDKRVQARDHPLFRLMHQQPNRRQTAQEFRDELVWHLAYDRNAYCRIVPGDDHPIGELDIIHPTRVSKVERREDGRVYYQIGPAAGQSGRIEWLRDDQIWHIRKPPLTPDGLRGVPVYESGRETLGRALAVERYGALWFRNSGQSGGVIKHPGRFRTPEERNDFMSQWRAARTGGAAHTDRLLYDGLTYEAHAVQNDQAQFIETLRECAVKVLSLWQMQPHRAGRLEKASFRNIESQGREFVVYALAPWVAAIEQAAWRDLLTEDEKSKYYFQFNMSGLLRGDIAARYQAYALGRQWGWISANDVLAMEDMEGIGPAGDIYLTPLNMVPADGATGQRRSNDIEDDRDAD